jgi:hypothetical protein
MRGCQSALRIGRECLPYRSHNDSAQFNYEAPNTIDEARPLLAANRMRRRYLPAVASLIPAMKLRLAHRRAGRYRPYQGPLIHS